MRELVEQWRATVVLACRQHHVPPALAAAVIEVESGGRQVGNDGQPLRSPAGAVGLMQLVPETAAGLGVDPTDAAQNIAGGVRYLRQQYERFGDWRLALAAYNAGPAAVERWGGLPPYEETQRYLEAVQSVLLDYLGWEADLIWGADPAHAPATGSWQEAAANILGVANARADALRQLARQARGLAERLAD